MSFRLIRQSCRTARRVAAPLAKRLKGLAARWEGGGAATPESTASGNLQRTVQEDALPLSAVMHGIVAERPNIRAQIGWMAEQGMVADGPPLRLRASYEAELAEHRCLLAADWLTLQASLQHLAALFPLPVPPEPAPPAQPRRRSFSPLGDLLAERPRGSLH